MSKWLVHDGLTWTNFEQDRKSLFTNSIDLRQVHFASETSAFCTLILYINSLFSLEAGKIWVAFPAVVLLSFLRYLESNESSAGQSWRSVHRFSSLCWGISHNLAPTRSGQGKQWPGPGLATEAKFVDLLVKCWFYLGVLPLCQHPSESPPCPLPWSIGSPFLPRWNSNFRWPFPPVSQWGSLPVATSWLTGKGLLYALQSVAGIGLLS